MDLWVATRSIAVADFASPVQVAGVNSSDNDYDPFISVDGRKLFWWVNTSSGRKLYQAERGTSGFGAPSQLAALESAAGEMHPILSPDMLTAYFGSYRAGGLGGEDIYVSTRSTTAAEFGTPEPVPGVNSSRDDSPSWVSGDGCALYLSSDRSGNFDVYVAKRGLAP